MDIVHTVVTLVDQFSGATETKTITVSQYTFDKMKNGIGSTFSHFDKATQIRSEWKVTDVKQST